MQPVIVRTWIFLMLLSWSCGFKDQTFIDLPRYEVPVAKIHHKEIPEDSLMVGQGLFYRQLTERNYSSIYGHAIFTPLSSGQKPPDYEIVLLSCQNNDTAFGLICTIDPDFYSVIDMMAFEKKAHKIISIGASSLGPDITDIKLLDIGRLTRRPDTLLVQASSQGILEEFPLCCDF